MTRVVVTGAAGFIGSNIIKGLNARGIDDIIAVDDLHQGDKFRNLVDLQIADYVDAERFYHVSMPTATMGQIEAVFHEGACSDTMELDGKYMMNNNYALSCNLYGRARPRARACCTRRRPPPTVAPSTFREDPGLNFRSMCTGTPSYCLTSACAASGR